MAITNLVPWKRGKSVPVKAGVQTLHDEMDRFFDEFFRGFGLAPWAPFTEMESYFSPRVDVIETDKEVKVSAELPGLTEKDVEVSLSHDVLTIKGEKKSEEEHKEHNTYRLERVYGSFQRNIPLPCEVDEEKVEAVFKNGVLTVTMPKVAEAQFRKQIQVKSA